MNKTIKAVAPFMHQNSINFKFAPYRAWQHLGGDVVKSLFPPKVFHGIAYRYELPTLWRNGNTAMLMFVEPVSLTFDTFPYYATHEIIPFIWDCWPRYYDKMERWMIRHKVRRAVFTSKQEMEAMKTRLPEVRMHHCPEAVDSSLYSPGKDLEARNIDLLEFGRSNENIIGDSCIMGINHVSTFENGRYIYSNDELFDAMGDAKITLCLPRSMTHPDIAEGVETLTQRYWEAMLSRMIIIGHAPKELTDITGYNPVIPVEKDNFVGQVKEILSHLSHYQPLVDRNRETALQLAPWELRMREVKEWLENI